MASSNRLDFVSSEHPYYILLLGQTGSGKTTLINLIINFLVNNGEIKSLEKVKEYVPHSECLKSDTKECTQYDISKWVPHLNYTIIDTPGFKDSQGTDVDQRNKLKIANMLKILPHINCIFVVVAGSLTRLDSNFIDALRDINDFLPKKACRSTVVIFTHHKLNDVKLSLKDEVQAIFHTKYGPFAFNNKYGPLIEMRHTNCKEGGGTPRLDDQHVQIELEKKLENELEKEREKDLEELAYSFKILTEIFSAIKDCDKIMANELTELERLTEEFEMNFLKYRYLKQIDKVISSHKVYTDHHNTVCTAEGCFSTCHTPCLYTGIFKQNVRNCMVFRNGNCSECNHPPSLHLITKYMYKKREDGVEEVWDLIGVQYFDETSANTEEKLPEHRQLSTDQQCSLLQSKILLITAKLQTITMRYSPRSLKSLKEKIGSHTTEDEFYKHSFFLEFESILKKEETDVSVKIEWACIILDINEENVNPATLEETKKQAIKDNQGNTHFVESIELAHTILQKHYPFKAEPYIPITPGELSPETESTF